MGKKTNVIENRKYKRLETHIPIDFTIVRINSELPGVDWEKGLTCNVSRGGLCLETDELSENTIRFLSKEGIYLDMRIHAPIASAPVKAVGEIVWHKSLDPKNSKHYMIGVKYQSITDENLNKIMGQVICIKCIRDSIIIGSIVLFILLVLMKTFL
ncbi:MAG: PilZ domain-containing protein [Candidatus Omnitrophica bacterium]|nr:PilZ domain-containing protein [Candidatus Omnitrophota bacterium]MCB9747201.1 PilZ domain-containing protein [Candidatus Omnitrophota bacterium]